MKPIIRNNVPTTYLEKFSLLDARWFRSVPLTFPALLLSAGNVFFVFPQSKRLAQEREIALILWPLTTEV